jgi:hypothetical protein
MPTSSYGGFDGISGANIGAFFARIPGVTDRYPTRDVPACAIWPTDGLEPEMKAP